MKLTLGTIAALAGIAAAILKYASSIYESDDNEDMRHEYARIRQWFRERWEGVSGKPWLQLHKYAIDQSLTALLHLVYRMRRLFDGSFMGIWISLVYLSLGGLAISNGGWLLMSLGIMLGLLGLLRLLMGHNDSEEEGPFILMLSVVSLPLSLVPFGLSLFFIMKFGINWGMVLALTTFPVLCLGARTFARMNFNFLDRRNMERQYDVITLQFYLFMISAGASLTVTLVSLLIGRLFDSAGQLPLTVQMLLSNLIFDGATMLATFQLLSWSLFEPEGKSSNKVKLPRWARVPFAIGLDIFVAGVFGICSIYFGLLLTESALSFSDAFQYFVARQPGEAGLYLGPLFWVSHTTFLPTFFYLAAILLAWVAKFLLLALAWHLDKTKIAKRPLHISALLCGVIAIIFATLATVIG